MKDDLVVRPRFKTYVYTGDLVERLCQDDASGPGRLANPILAIVRLLMELLGKNR